ncbi:hypothetical protein J2W80_006163 [Methylorubrum extorquens]|nr:hypothetical protein [Methylorubrum extorquens]MCP1590938.1 hypothetical protein [Methylorubrum extorquens]
MKIEQLTISNFRYFGPEPTRDLTGWLWTGLIERISQD